MMIMNIFDPKTGAVSAVPADRMGESRRQQFVAAAEQQGMMVTFTTKR